MAEVDLVALERAGCHCVERWHGELQWAGRMITCPFHGLPFEALMANKTPEEIQAANEARLAAALRAVSHE